MKFSRAKPVDSCQMSNGCIKYSTFVWLTHSCKIIYTFSSHWYNKIDIWNEKFPKMTNIIISFLQCSKKIELISFVTVVSWFVLCNSFMLWNECVYCSPTTNAWSSQVNVAALFSFDHAKIHQNYALLLFYLYHQTVLRHLNNEICGCYS